MKLRFFAKDDHVQGLPCLVTVPGARPLTGQRPHYVGRGCTPGDKSTPTAYPALAEGFECDSESDIGGELVSRVRKELAQHGDLCLWPADAATARACGVQFVQVELRDGVFAPVEAAPAGGAGNRTDGHSDNNEGDDHELEGTR